MGRERLDFEFRALELADIPYERDETAFRAGIARITVHPVVDGNRVRMSVTFADSYPYFRFEVTARTLDFPHHQHPFAKNLCLLGRATDSWHIRDTVAGILVEQLPKIFKTGGTNGGDEVAGLEEEQGEPFSDYYGYPPAMIQLDGSCKIPDAANSGTMLLGVISPEPSQLLRGIALEIRDERGDVLYEAPIAVSSIYGRHLIHARWVRSPVIVKRNEAQAVFAEASKLDPDAASLHWSEPFPSGASPRLRYQVRGVLFPEEVALRKIGQGWLFAVRVQLAVTDSGAVPYSKFIPPTRHQVPRSGDKWARPQHYLARAGRSGPADLGARIPELAPLRDKTIAVFGTGCIGAPSIFEFARAGAKKLRILDHDFLDPATTVRWPLGINAAGQLKVDILAQEIKRQYPYTEVSSFVHNLGGVRNLNAGKADAPSEPEVLAQMLEGADLIYDATAELGVQRFLSDLALERNIPYIAVSGTQGGWGGTVVRVRPAVTAGCWLCYQLDNALPSPSAKRDDSLQPSGCGNPTFTGSGFDMTEIALQGVRLTVSTLTAGVAGAYPPANWDVGLISHRSPDGAELLPTVLVKDLPRHPNCPSCSARAASVPIPV